MKKRLTIIISILWVCGQYSCEKPVLDNPFSGDITPDIDIITNDGLNGVVISNSEITISWSPNIYAFEFSHLLNPIDTVWSEWNQDTMIHYNYLDEGEYSFIIKSRFQEGEEKENSDSLSFSVDAVVSNSLRIYPLLSKVDNLETFNIDVFAEDVVQLTGAQIELTYNNQCVSFDNSTKGSFLSESLGQSIQLEKHENGILILTLATALDVENQNIPTGITGTGSLAQVTFKANLLESCNSNSTEINFTDNGWFIMSPDDSLTISSMINGVVEIQ